MKNSRALLSVVASALFSLPLFANVLGDMQTFAPNTDGLDFITVHSARPLNESYFAFSNYLNYASDHLLVYKNLADQDQIHYPNHFFEYDFGVSYGLTKSIQLSLMAPVLLDYAGQKTEGIDIEVTKGIHSLRPGTKWTFYDGGNDFASLLFSVDVPQVVNSPYVGNGAKPIYNLEGAYSFKRQTSMHSVNMGFRKREAATIPDDAHMFPLKDQFLLSYGYSDKWSSTARWVFEIFGSTPVQKDPYKNAVDASSLDVLLGMKHFWWKYLRFDWGATVEPGVKSLSPSWRAFAGLVYYWKNDLSGEDSFKNENTSTPEPAPVKVAPIINDFVVTPESAEIFEGEDLEIHGTGGLEPYEYKVISGPGRIADGGIFQASSKPGPARVEVREQRGQIRFVSVMVKESPKADKVIRLENLKFIFAKNQLIDASKKSLAHDIQQLEGESIRQIIVEGHTDSVGNSESNRELGRKRADVVRNDLIKQLKLKPSQVKLVSYGEDRPLSTNANARGRQINRRVELKVYLNK